MLNLHRRLHAFVREIAGAVAPMSDLRVFSG